MTIKDEIKQDNAKWFPYDDSVMSEREAREYDLKRDARVEMRLLELLEDESFLNDCIINNDVVLQNIRLMIKLAVTKGATGSTVYEQGIVNALRKELNEYAQKTAD